MLGESYFILEFPDSHYSRPYKNMSNKDWPEIHKTEAKLYFLFRILELLSVPRTFPGHLFQSRH